MEIYSITDFKGHKAINFVLEGLSSDPSQAPLLEGRLYYNSQTKKVMTYNGTQWVSVGVLSYDELSSRPQINSVVLTGDKTAAQLKLKPADVYLIGVTNTAPLNPQVGDIYFNKVDKLLYNCTTQGVWGTGYEPTYGTFYIEKVHGNIYRYDLDTLVIVGIVPATASAGQVFAGPITGNDATPTFRALEKSDLPLASESAESGGTTTSLVTTGEKYIWNSKQEALVSGSNIKTINTFSLLGSGDIEIGTYSEPITITSSTEPSITPGGNVTMTNLTATDGGSTGGITGGTYQIGQIIQALVSKAHSHHAVNTAHSSHSNHSSHGSGALCCK